MRPTPSMPPFPSLGQRPALALVREDLDVLRELVGGQVLEREPDALAPVLVDHQHVGGVLEVPAAVAGPAAVALVAGVGIRLLRGPPRRLLLPPLLPPPPPPPIRRGPVLRGARGAPRARGGLR